MSTLLLHKGSRMTHALQVVEDRRIARLFAPHKGGSGADRLIRRTLRIGRLALMIIAVLSFIVTLLIEFGVITLSGSNLPLIQQIIYSLFMALLLFLPPALATLQHFALMFDLLYISMLLIRRDKRSKFRWDLVRITNIPARSYVLCKQRALLKQIYPEAVWLGVLRALFICMWGFLFPVKTTLSLLDVPLMVIAATLVILFTLQSMELTIACGLCMALMLPRGGMLLQALAARTLLLVATALGILLPMQILGESIPRLIGFTLLDGGIALSWNVLSITFDQWTQILIPWTAVLLALLIYRILIGLVLWIAQRVAVAYGLEQP